MSSTQPSRRRPRRFLLRPEVLETRQLLTGGAGNTFALLTATISQPGGSVTVPFTISSPQFTRPNGSMVLGVDVAPGQGSTVSPQITSVHQADGAVIPPAFHTGLQRSSRRSGAGGAADPTAVLERIDAPPGQSGGSTTYDVTIQARNNTSGQVLVGFYLPGDVNGTGTVDQADLQAIRAALSTRSGLPRYNFDADSNRDGRITPTDLAIARQNLDVSTTIVPTVSANIDPATVTGYPVDVTSIQNVHFTGQTSPMASVTYSEIHNKTPDVTTTADANGNYSLNVPLGLGQNTFKVTSTDGFGQTITGQLNPVIYSTNIMPPPTTTSSSSSSNSSSATATASTPTASTATTTTPAPSSSSQPIPFLSQRANQQLKSVVYALKNGLNTTINDLKGNKATPRAQAGKTTAADNATQTATTSPASTATGSSGTSSSNG